MLWRQSLVSYKISSNSFSFIDFVQYLKIRLPRQLPKTSRKLVIANDFFYEIFVGEENLTKGVP